MSPASACDSPGRWGPIEALLELPSSGAPRALGIVCHPHPLFGGALTNKVVHSVARAFIAQGAATLRFNFRGVGASAGRYMTRVVARPRICSPWSQLPHALSRPAVVARRLLVRQLRCAARPARMQAARLVTVAPPVGRWDFSEVAAPGCPWLVIQGDADELVDHQAVAAWIASLDASARFVLLPGAEHFFHGRLHEVKAAVADFLGS